jgi:cytochrome c peroxidase
MFWDGRVSGTAATGFSTPAGASLPAGLNNALAAQAMMPVTSRAEMRGIAGDMAVDLSLNELAMLDDTAFTAIWQGIMQRVLSYPAYVTKFNTAYSLVPTNQLGFQHAANAIAAFEVATWTKVNTPFDHYLAGDDAALSEAAKRGGLLFYGRAICSSCHSGSLFTNQQFVNIGVPQLGPGMTTGTSPEAPLDFGHGRVSGNASERFQFRVPPLRNVELTAPYMHDGAYTTLAAAVKHYRNPPGAQDGYDVTQLPANLQGRVLLDPATKAAVLSTLDVRMQAPISLSDAEVQDIVEFLKSLTDPTALDQSAEVPATVPSGLPVN